MELPLSNSHPENGCPAGTDWNYTFRMSTDYALQTYTVDKKCTVCIREEDFAHGAGSDFIWFSSPTSVELLNIYPTVTGLNQALHI